MRSIWGWMAGRKTYLLAGGVIFVLLTLVFLGRLTPETGIVLVSFAVCGFGVTFRHALERHHDEAIAVLRGVALAGEAAAVHNVPGALQAAEATLPQGVKLAEELGKEESMEKGS
jgi:hypothetical protein